MALTLHAVDLVNILFIAMGIGVCGLCFMQITASRHLRQVVRQYFQIFFALIFLYITTHLARSLMDGHPGQGITIALKLVTFFEVLSAGFMAHMMTMLVLYVADPPKKTAKILFLVLAALLAVHGLALAIDWFFGAIWYFDAGNVYHRGSLYVISNLSPLFMLLISAVLLVRFSEKYERRVKSAFWAYIIAPVAAIAVQLLFYGVQFIIFATVSAAVYLFAVIVQKQNEEYEKQKVESSRLETELTMAASIQAAMLPGTFPAFPDRPDFDIYASMDPAKEVGGDFYDYFLVDDDHLCLVMADVSGKGVPAALFMMASMIVLASHAKQGKSPAQILTDTNAAICASNQEEMFVTVWLGILELSTGRLTAANAGHEYPVIRHGDGRFELLKDKHGFVIGGLEGVRYRQYELTLEPGSSLFLYTDGVPEATDRDKQLFGTDRMLEALNQDPAAAPETVLRNVRRAVDSFVGAAEQFDDLTMLCMAYSGPKKEEQHDRSL